MKKLILVCALTLLGDSVFAQFQNNTVSRNGFVALTVGVGVPFMNNDRFDQWMQRNYGRHYNNLVDGYGAITLVGNYFDFGLQASFSSNDFAAGDIYFGARMTPYRSPIISFLNIGFGFNDFKDDSFSPLNYNLTNEEMNQDMKLRYTSYYFSVSSINYINPLSFRFGRKGHTAFRTGFFVNYAFATFGKKWEYGYDQQTNETGTDPDGNSYDYTGSKFIGRRVNIPVLGSQFVNLGITFSLTINEK